MRRDVEEIRALVGAIMNDAKGQTYELLDQVDERLARSASPEEIDGVVDDTAIAVTDLWLDAFRAVYRIVYA